MEFTFKIDKRRFAYFIDGEQVDYIFWREKFYPILIARAETMESEAQALRKMANEL